MKKFLVLSLLLACFGIVNAQQRSMKMVVDSRGNAVGRYVESGTSTYYISVQDVTTVPKRGHRVVTYSAAKGQGVVYYEQTHTGNLNVRKSPTTNSPVVAKIPDPAGYVPDCYKCLGFVKGWFKVKVDGKVGYVRSDLLDWDGMCTF
ncbi:MAG: SH3 domain-containing protein [Muribaculaceae bacterium]|nr:SH3 domain-containing protein [Muribaculaceae bacterium]